MRFPILFLLLLVALPLSAAHAPKSPHKRGEFMREGYVVGGLAADEFSLLRAERFDLPGGIERWTLQFGDKAGNPLKKEPAYFHMSLDPKTKRVVLDLAQVSKTAVDQKDLSKIFWESKVVSNTVMTMDPLDHSTNIVLLLKGATELRVAKDFTRGTLVIDFKKNGISDL